MDCAVELEVGVTVAVTDAVEIPTVFVSSLE